MIYSNTEAILNTDYAFDSLTYQANDWNDTYIAIFTYWISYESNESNISSVTITKYVDLVVSASQHTYAYKQNTQNTYIIPEKSHNVDLIYSHK